MNFCEFFGECSNKCYKFCRFFGIAGNIFDNTESEKRNKSVAKPRWRKCETIFNIFTKKLAIRNCDTIVNFSSEKIVMNIFRFLELNYSAGCVCAVLRIFINFSSIFMNF
jgi:hypothetical protein